MRRRIWLVWTGVSAALLSAGGAGALAASSAPKANTPKAKPVVLRCTMSLATVPPDGSATVDQPASQGAQYGKASCARKSFGAGVAADSFTVPDTGDTVARYWQYLAAGSIAGKFDLTPAEGAPLSGQSFTAQSWTGTVTIVSGTGIYRGIKGKKGTGTMTCSSPDSVHLTCHEKIKVFLPPTA